MKHVEEQGYHLAKGAWGYTSRLMLIVVALFGLLAFGRLLFGVGLDSTDAGAWDRSGMVIRTDSETGIQYLSVPGHGLTPRIGVDGLPMVAR